MVDIYYRKTCSSSRKALKNLDSYGVKYQKHPINQITKKKLLLALTLTDLGIESLIKVRGSKDTLIKVSQLYDMTVSEAIDFILRNPEILRTPIILSKNKLLIGYNDIEIRQFIPHLKRIYTRT